MSTWKAIRVRYEWLRLRNGISGSHRTGVTETCPICDDPVSRWARCSFTPLQKLRWNHQPYPVQFTCHWKILHLLLFSFAKESFKHICEHKTNPRRLTLNSLFPVVHIAWFQRRFRLLLLKKENQPSHLNRFFIPRQRNVCILNVFKCFDWWRDSGEGLWATLVLPQLLLARPR